MNCTYIYDNTCYDLDKNINYANYIISGLILLGFFGIPIYCAMRYCQIKKQMHKQRQIQNQNQNTDINNRIVLIPGYIHKDEDQLPAYIEERNNPVRII